jgi:hypothetical protein
MFFFRAAKEDKSLLKKRLRFCQRLAKLAYQEAELVCDKNYLHYFKVELRVDGLNTLVYFSLDTISRAVVAFCVLEKIPGWMGKETRMLFTHPNWRGKGKAIELYDVIMADGVIVISGKSHNPNSRQLWKKLVGLEKYTTWAQDIKDLKRVAPILVDDDEELFCELKLYAAEKRNPIEDIRIIAFNPRSK